MSQQDEFARTMMDIGFMGLLNGLSQQAEAIFLHYSKDESESIADAGKIGLGLQKMMSGDGEGALAIFETQMEEGKKFQAEATAFSILAADRSKMGSRADALREKIKDVQWPAGDHGLLEVVGVR